MGGICRLYIQGSERSRLIKDIISIHEGEGGLAAVISKKKKKGNGMQREKERKAHLSKTTRVLKEKREPCSWGEHFSQVRRKACLPAKSLNFSDMVIPFSERKK